MDCIHLRKVRGGWLCWLRLCEISRAACIACRPRTDKPDKTNLPALSEHPGLAPRTRALDELGRCMRIGAQLKEERWRTK